MLRKRKKGSEIAPRTTTLRWSHLLLSPMLVFVLLVQFAPIGLFVMNDAAHDCPHCNGTAVSEAMPHKMKCMHPGASNRHAKHSGMHTMHGMHAAGPSSKDEPSFCGCGQNDSPLTLAPSIAKTMFATEQTEPQRSETDYRFGADPAFVRPVRGEGPFHPPRPV